MLYSELVTKRLLSQEPWKISEEGDTAIIDLSTCYRIDSKSGVEYMIGDKYTSNANLVRLIDIAKAGGLAGIKVSRVEFKGYIAIEAYKDQVELIKAQNCEKIKAQ